MVGRWLGFIVFQSTRSQDRDNIFKISINIRTYFNPLGRKTETFVVLYHHLQLFHFNPLGRKTETLPVSFASFFWRISIHSVARPRLSLVHSKVLSLVFQSTRSQDRDLTDTSIIFILKYFNPLGRKTETYAILRSTTKNNISIHSVARPRRPTAISMLVSPEYFNPLGRKTETYSIISYSRTFVFQSTRSQDRDNL